MKPKANALRLALLAGAMLVTGVGMTALAHPARADDDWRDHDDRWRAHVRHEEGWRHREEWRRHWDHRYWDDVRGVYVYEPPTVVYDPPPPPGIGFAFRFGN